MNSCSDSYKAAGVDITAGYEAVELMKKHIARTMTKGALSDIGGFGGLFELDLEGIKRPVLVSGTDGGRHQTEDRVFNGQTRHSRHRLCRDVCKRHYLLRGQSPSSFWTISRWGKNRPEKIESIVAGVSEGCVQSGCALIGGETAEMPGFYPEDEYDLAGFLRRRRG